MPEIEARLIALGIVLPALATFFVGLRIWVRLTRPAKFGTDDYLILVAVCLVWGMGITQILGILDLSFIFQGIHSYATGATVGDLGEKIGELPNGQPIIDSRTQLFLKVVHHHSSRKRVTSLVGSDLSNALNYDIF